MSSVSPPVQLPGAHPPSLPETRSPSANWEDELAGDRDSLFRQRQLQQHLQRDLWHRLEEVQIALREADQQGAIWTPLLDQMAAQGFWPTRWEVEQCKLSPEHTPVLEERAARIESWLAGLDAPRPAQPLLAFDSPTFVAAVIKHVPAPDQEFARAVVEHHPRLAHHLAARGELSEEAVNWLAHQSCRALAAEDQASASFPRRPMATLTRLAQQGQELPEDQLAEAVETLCTRDRGEEVLQLLEQLGSHAPPSLLRRAWKRLPAELGDPLHKHPAASLELKRLMLRSTSGHRLFQFRKAMLSDPELRSDPEIRTHLRGSRSPQVLLGLLLEADPPEFDAIFSDLIRQDLPSAAQLVMHRWPDKMPDLEGGSERNQYQIKETLWEQAQRHVGEVDRALARSDHEMLIQEFYRVQARGVPPRHCEARLVAADPPVHPAQEVWDNLYRYTERRAVLSRTLRRLMGHDPAHLLTLLHEDTTRVPSKLEEVPLSRVLGWWKQAPSAAEKLMEVLDDFTDLDQKEAVISALESGREVGVYRALMRYARARVEDLIQKDQARTLDRLVHNVPFLRRVPRLWEQDFEALNISDDRLAFWVRKAPRPNWTRKTFQALYNRAPLRAALLLKRHPEVASLLSSTRLTDLLGHENPTVRQAVLQATRTRRADSGQKTRSALHR